MNLQNVAKIVMPDGEVKAIHNSNGDLLWGKVNYGVKYLGDSSQNGTPTPSSPAPIMVATGENILTISDGVNTQNYKINLGKNLIEGSNSAITQLQRVTSAASGNGFTITSTASSGACYAVVPIPNIASLLGKTVAVSYNESGSGTNVSIYYLNTSNRATTPLAGYSNRKITFPKTLGSNAGVGLVFYTSNNGNATYTDIQVELDSSTSYAPYFTPIELCKIDTYQDYIYKNGNKWYKHKEIDKIAFSDMVFTAGQIGTTGHYRMWSTTVKNVIAPVQNNSQVASIMSNAYEAKSADSTYAKNIGISLNAGKNIIIYDPSYDENTPSNFIAAMPKIGATLYYALATSTEEEITNSTLVSQLEDAQRWLIRYGYSSQVSGNLPIIIGKTEL